MCFSSREVLFGFGNSIAYYSKVGGKQYIRKCINDKKTGEYRDDRLFYLRWNGAIGSYVFPEDDIENEDRFNFSIPQGEGGAYGKNEARAHRFEFYNMIYPLFKLKEDTMAFFNFGSDLLELLDPDGKVLGSAPISFHKGSTGINPLAKNDRAENDGWR